MPAREDRKYQEAVALWRSLSDQPPPPGDAAAVLEAAIGLSAVEAYDRFRSRWLNDPSITWAVYRSAPPDLA